MRLLAGLVCAACLLGSGVAHADDAMTAGDLYDICTSNDSQSKSACRFYLLGIAQGIEVGMDIADGKASAGRMCLPDNTPASAIELAVKMKLGQDLAVFPNDRKMDASGFVGAALVSTFPCKK